MNAHVLKRQCAILATIYVASYDEAIDVVRQYEDATNSKFLVIKRRTYASGIVKNY